MVSIWCLAQNGWAQSSYHTNRAFNKVNFSIPGVPTAYEVYNMAGQLTMVVGPTNVITNSFYSKEYMSVALGHESSTAAWSALLAGYPANNNVHNNKFYDNAGWIKGLKQTTDGKWGGYIWAMQNTVNFKTSITNIWVSTNGVTNAISKVLVATIGDYAPMQTLEDTGPTFGELTNNPPSGGSSDDMSYTAEFTAYYELTNMPAIWIEPVLTNVCINYGNVNFSLSANSKAPSGVSWLITPTNGVTLTGYPSNAVVNVGGIATSYVIRATSYDNTNIFGLAVLNVVQMGSPLQYKTGTNAWTDMPDPLYVCSNATVCFKATKIPANAGWPSGKPVWTFDGQSGGAGTGENSHAFTTVSSSTTDYKIVTAECGNAVTGKLLVCNIDSETEAIIPTNRSRTQIGVGEQVALSITPVIGATIWSLSGGGSLDGTNGASTIFTAPDTVTNCTITVNFEEGSFTKEFSVFAPTGIVSAQIESTTHFALGYSAAKMHLYPIIIGPTNVSFYQVKLMEVGEDASNITGYFLTNTPPSHIGNGADVWFSLSQDNSWPIDWDWAGLWGSPPPWSSGGFTWNIPARWKVGNGSTNSMTGWNQIFSIDANGTVTVQKFGHGVTRTTNDVITTY